jgi:chromosome segregation ATPase
MNIEAINDVLKLVTDASAYKEQLEALKKEQERVLELYGNAKDLREAAAKADAAKVDRDAAKAILEAAHNTADELVANANTKVAEMTKETDKALAEAARKVVEAEALKVSYVEGMKSLEGHRKVIEDRAIELHKKEEEVQALQEAVSERLVKLKSVMG